MIDAADAVLFDPAEMPRRAAMRTVGIDDLRAARMAAIERKVLAHDADRLGMAGGQILAAIERVPELPHENTAGRAGARGGDVRELRHHGLCARRRAAFDERHGLCSRKHRSLIAGAGSTWFFTRACRYFDIRSGILRAKARGAQHHT